MTSFNGFFSLGSAVAEVASGAEGLGATAVVAPVLPVFIQGAALDRKKPSQSVALRR